ncbi:hypothetical protein [Burkholderia ubonensis]|uniref:hypothetical protein n=1 Tax=Burkholderia ubonensis TaxID=101571 RepID=UPI000A72EE76|nr:hypothetical protein [Burkholderia ubonensis]
MTTENKKSPTPEQASEAVPQRQRTENPTAEAIFEQASGGGNLICSKFEDGKSRADALTDDAARKIAHRIYCRLGLCGSNPLCFNGADATTQQRWISAIKDACPLFAASPVEQPAAAPADERATWSNARDSLAVAMSGFAGRSGNRDFNAAIGVLDAITEPGLPLAWLRTARTASANETGAEGADDLNERAHLAAGKWANANTTISEALANRDGCIAGARFPAMAAAAPADYKGDAVPKWIFDQVVNTLAPAWDYVQTHQEQFNALAGDDKTKIVVEEFLKHARAAASPAAEARAEIASKMERLINAVNAYTGIGGWYAKQIQDLCSSLLMTLAAPQPAQADAPATIPDECVASGASCSYAPEGRHGEMQCRYCGKAQADALDEEQRDALNEAICWANDDGLPGTADQLRSILALHEQADAPAEAREPARHEWDATGERCVKCGDKDWFANPHCSESRIKGSATADAGSGDAIARSKRILALVDDYHEKPTADSRTALRKALMDEFAITQPASMGASLTEKQRAVIERAISEVELSCQYELANELRALLNGADHDR